MELIIFGLGATGLTLGWFESYYKPRIEKVHNICVLWYNGKQGRKRVILW